MVGTAVYVLVAAVLDQTTTAFGFAAHSRGLGGDEEKEQLKNYGEFCEGPQDCQSNICGTQCVADVGSCLCPTFKGLGAAPQECRPVCCATITFVNTTKIEEWFAVCVDDDAEISRHRRARSLDRGRSCPNDWTQSVEADGRLLVASDDGVEDHTRNEGLVEESVRNAHTNHYADVALDENTIGQGSFGSECRSWSDCSSGICSAKCSCSDALLETPQPCTCENVRGRSGGAPAKATCGGFFVADNPCATHCPPCSAEECRTLPKECRWGCTAGSAKGECSAWPQFYLQTDRCWRCCNANFCKGSRGLRGDWIQQVSSRLPGADDNGEDLWTSEIITCPSSHTWVGGRCSPTCSFPKNVSLRKILDLGNGSWTLDRLLNVPFSGGAVIEVECPPGFEGEQDSWKLRCDGRRWVGEEQARCTRIKCDFPQDPVGVWLVIGEQTASMSLFCNEGYVPGEGSRAINCSTLHNRSFDRLSLAKCVPGGPGDAELWRQELLLGSLQTLMSGMLVSLIILLAFLHGFPASWSRADTAVVVSGREDAPVNAGFVE